MQFKAVAALAFASTAAAWYNATTTEVVTSFTTYCPEATTLTYGSSTYTITEATTLTITDCPCTLTKPVYTSSSVAAPTYNATSTGGSVGTTSAVVTSSPSATAVPASGAGKAVAFSGASLAGLLGLVAYLL